MKLGQYSPAGSSVHGILQARRLEWIAISFSMGIFPTQGSNLHSHWKADSLPLSHLGSPVLLCPALFLESARKLSSSLHLLTSIEEPVSRSRFDSSPKWFALLWSVHFPSECLFARSGLLK